MLFLTQLGIPHVSAEGPQGTSIVFPHVAHADLALATLTGSGFTVTRPAPRCLFIAPVAVPRWRERHPSAHRALFWSVMVLILPVPYFSVPAYGYFAVRWYVRRHGKPRAMRPGNGKRRASRPNGYYAGSPATPWYGDHTSSEAFRAHARRLAQQGAADMSAAGLYEHVNVNGTVTTGKRV